MNNLFEVLKDLRKIKKRKYPEFLLSIDLIDDDDDYPEVSFLLLGPPDTPYEEYSFSGILKFKQRYRAYPPKVHFVTRCYHPNVDPSNGEICFNLIDDDWSESMNISLIIWGIYELLKEPNCDSALNGKASKHYRNNEEKFKTRVGSWAEGEY